MAEITYDQLRQAGACYAELTRFRTRFGDRVTVTVEAAEQYAGDYGCGHWTWLADRFLTDAARAEYERVADTAAAEYSRATDAAWAEYERVMDAAWAEWNRLDRAATVNHDRIGPATRVLTYIRARDTAWMQFSRVTNPAQAEYDRASAVAFARLYIAQCSQVTELLGNLGELNQG
jgi:hypothetical protein